MIKKFENFFSGINIGSDDPNFNSTVVRNNTNVDNYTSNEEFQSRITQEKENIINQIIESDLNIEDLRKIKNLLDNLL
jgi:hypothetical protein